MPRYSVIAISGAVQNIRPSLLAHHALPTELQRPDLRPLVVTSGQDDGSRVVMLPFAPERTQPLGVLKASRLADFNINTKREQETLRIDVEVG